MRRALKLVLYLGTVFGIIAPIAVPYYFVFMTRLSEPNSWVVEVGPDYLVYQPSPTIPAGETKSTVVEEHAAGLVVVLGSAIGSERFQVALPELTLLWRRVNSIEGAKVIEVAGGAREVRFWDGPELFAAELRSGVDVEPRRLGGIDADSVYWTQFDATRNEWWVYGVQFGESGATDSGWVVLTDSDGNELERVAVTLRPYVRTRMMADGSGLLVKEAAAAWRVWRTPSGLGYELVDTTIEGTGSRCANAAAGPWRGGPSLVSCDGDMFLVGDRWEAWAGERGTRDGLVGVWEADGLTRVLTADGRVFERWAKGGESDSGDGTSDAFVEVVVDGLTGGDLFSPMSWFRGDAWWVYDAQGRVHEYVFEGRGVRLESTGLVLPADVMQWFSTEYEAEKVEG